MLARHKPCQRVISTGDNQSYCHEAYLQLQYRAKVSHVCTCVNGDIRGTSEGAAVQIQQLGCSCLPYRRLDISQPPSHLLQRLQVPKTFLTVMLRYSTTSCNQQIHHRAQAT